MKQRSAREKDNESKKEDVRETLKRTRSDIGISNLPSEIPMTLSKSPDVKITGIRRRKNMTDDAEEMRDFAKKTTTEDMTQDEATFKAEVTDELLETTRRLKNSLEQTHERLQNSNN